MEDKRKNLYQIDGSAGPALYFLTSSGEMHLLEGSTLNSLPTKEHNELTQLFYTLLINAVWDGLGTVDTERSG